MNKLYRNVLHVLQSISTKVILVIIILVLPVNILTIKQNDMAKETVIDRAVDEAENIAQIHLKELKSRIENQLFLLSYLLTKDANCIQMKKQSEDTYIYDKAKYQFYYTLSNMAAMIHGGDGYFYYMREKNDFLCSITQYENQKLKKEIRNYVIENCENTDAFGGRVREFLGESYFLLLLNLPNLTYGGWIKIEPVKQEIETLLMYGNAEVIISEKPFDTQDPGRIMVSVGDNNLWINVLLDKILISGNLSDSLHHIHVITCCMLFSIPFLYLFMYYLLIKPLVKLNQAHTEIRKGNNNYHIEEKAGSVEYKEVFQSFNQMVDMIEKFKVDNYEKEISKQKMELRNLQLQIRPHFLQNTFNLIFTLAQRGENDTIQDIVLYLSDYFRYIFRENKELELFGKELELIRKYVSMASIRYDHLITFEYHIDPEVLLVRTPPLLVHNFVENAVKHAFDGEHPLMIILEGYYEEGYVNLIISDNGIGMTESELEILRNLLETPNDEQYSHVGIANSIRRLKYFYSSEASIQVESVEKEGTSFVVMFPYNLEDDDA